MNWRIKDVVMPIHCNDVLQLLWWCLLGWISNLEHNLWKKTVFSRFVVGSMTELVLIWKKRINEHFWVAIWMIMLDSLNIENVLIHSHYCPVETNVKSVVMVRTSVSLIGQYISHAHKLIDDLWKMCRSLPYAILCPLVWWEILCKFVWVCVFLLLLLLIVNESLFWQLFNVVQSNWYHFHEA